MYDLKDFDRRRFLQDGLAAAGLAPPQMTQAHTTTPVQPAANASFDPLSQIDAGALNFAYVEPRPADGRKVILLFRRLPRPVSA